MNGKFPLSFLSACLFCGTVKAQTNDIMQNKDVTPESLIKALTPKADATPSGGEADAKAEEPGSGPRMRQFKMVRDKPGASPSPSPTDRRRARTARYQSAIEEVLRKAPTAADIPLCGPNAFAVCMPTKAGIVADAALGSPQLSIPVADVRRKVAYLFGNNDVQRFLNRIDAKQIIVVSDSCFSGTLTREQSIDAPRTAPHEQLLTRRAVVTLSSGDEEPVTDEGIGGHSIFAYHFLDEIQHIQKMSPASAAHERLREKVARSYPQTPQLGGILSAGHMSGANYLFEVK